MISKGSAIEMSVAKYLAKKLSTPLKLRSSRAASNWPLRATVGQKSSSVQMAAACHVGGSVLVHVARSGQLDAALDERSLRLNVNRFCQISVIFQYIK